MFCRTSPGVAAAGRRGSPIRRGRCAGEPFESLVLAVTALAADDGMEMTSPAEVTLLLERARGGDVGARDALLEALYVELRVLARDAFRRERPGHTLEATALVNEVCVRLLSSESLPGRNRMQLRAFVAKAMRHVLIDHARERTRLKRGGAHKKIPFNGELVIGEAPSHELIDLDVALVRLAAIDARKAKVVELRYFGGLTIDEIAEQLEVSRITVKRDWNVARAWLANELDVDDGSSVH